MEKDISLTQILDLLFNSQVYMGLSCTEIDRNVI